MNYNVSGEIRCVMEKLFWIGIIWIAFAVGIAIISIVIFAITSKKIRNELEQEYGKPQRYNR